MYNVLVVDDDHLVRKGFIGALPWEKHGFRVAGEANTGKKALAFLREQPVDLLITDLAMPLMSGIELMKQVREAYPHTAMVVLTFHQDFELIQEALRLGALDYIAKVELEEDRIDDMLGRIAERMKGRERTPDMRAVRELTANWSDTCWMTDGEEFDRLLAETEGHALDAEILARMFAAASAAWRLALPEPLAALTASFAAAPAEWAVSARKLRTALLQSSQQLPYSDDVRNCIWRAVALIRREFQNELHLPDIAREVGMSRSYFSRCFKDIAGHTFNDFVRELRIGHAKGLLAKTNKSVAWIASQSGYPNEKYFCKVFRETTGLQPSEFRKKPE